MFIWNKMHMGAGSSLQSTNAGSNTAVHAGSLDEPRAFRCLVLPQEPRSPLSPPGFPYGSGFLHAGKRLSQLCKQHPTAEVTVRAAPLARQGAVLSSSSVCQAQGQDRGQLVLVFRGRVPRRQGCSAGTQPFQEFPL